MASRSPAMDAAMARQKYIRALEMKKRIAKASRHRRTPLTRVDEVDEEENGNNQTQIRSGHDDSQRINRFRANKKKSKKSKKRSIKKSPKRRSRSLKKRSPKKHK